MGGGGLCRFRFRLGDNVTETYRPGPRVGNLAGVLCPLVVMPVFVGKRPIEDIADVGHRVHADGGPLEHRAGAETDRQGRI